MKKLDNACVALCVESIDNTSSELENAIYEMSKKITILIGSNNFRGEAADNAKAYLQDAAMNIVAGSLNVLQELTDAADEMKKIFLDYESDAEGVVSEKRLTTVQNDLDNTYKAGFDDILSEISPILTKAANYISTTSLSSKDVKDAYDDGDTHLTKMNENLSTADTDAKKKLDDVLAHLFNLRAMIQSYAGTRNNEGDIDYSKVASLTTYYKEDSKNLDAKRKNDPFSYHAGTVSAWEVEGGIGRKKDLYAYGGNQVFTAGGMVQTHDLSVKTKGEASVAALYGGFQATKWLNGTGEATFLHAEGSAEAGLGGDIVGVSAEGAVSYAEAKGEIKVGTDDFNGTGKVDAKLLSAEGYAKCYVKKDEWGFGVGGEGTTAEVSASANVDFLHVKAKDSSTGHDEHLFSIGASPKLTAGVGGEASISGKKVIDTDFIDVHTVNVKLGGKLGLGLALDITLPYIWAD